MRWNWAVVRQACLLAFFTCLAAVLCVLIGVLISSPFPACDSRPKWFEGAIFYEIFPASYQDTDGDGFGDFKGIVQHLKYIKQLGVKAIRLSSVFCALDYPLEYEHIIDLRNVDPHLGRMMDFKTMVKEAHQLGLKVVLDINPTVTSDQHTWALHWQRGIDGYQHFYASPNRSKAPPEMEDQFGPPPDQWELIQRTFGGHYTVNWSNPSVQKEYRRTLSFWIETGVDGFYMKHLDKLHVTDPDDILLVVRQWREELDRFRLWNSNEDRVLITSLKFAEELEHRVLDPAYVLELFDLVDVPLQIRRNLSEPLARSLSHQISSVEFSDWRTRPNAPWVMWHLGSADTFRLATRIDTALRETAIYFLLMLQESVSIFYGDEIGLMDSYEPDSGKVYRGGQFAPMHWTSNNMTAGFTNSTLDSWLPMSQNIEKINVLALRPIIQRFGNFAKVHNTYSQNRTYYIHGKDPSLFLMERPGPGNSRLVACANFGQDNYTKDFTKMFAKVNFLASVGNFSPANIRNLNILKGDAFAAEVR